MAACRRLGAWAFPLGYEHRGGVARPPGGELANTAQRSAIASSVAAGDGRGAMAAASVNDGAMGFLLAPGRTLLRMATGLASHLAATPAPTVAPTPSLQDRLAQLRAKEAALREKKAKLTPGDRAAAVALADEINSYNAERKPLLAEVQQHPEAAQ